MRRKRWFARKLIDNFYIFLLSDHTQHLNVKMYPVPYGDLVLRYFRSEQNVANSEIFSFGMPSFLRSSFDRLFLFSVLLVLTY